MICSGRFGVLIVWVFLRSCMPRYQPRQGVRKQSRWLQATSSSKSVLSGKKKKSLSGLNNSKRPFGIILRHAFIDLPSIRECMKNNHQCRGAQTTYEHKHPGPLHISPKQRGCTGQTHGHDYGMNEVLSSLPLFLCSQFFPFTTMRQK